MQIVIEIPNDKIPDRQALLDISLHFIDGEVCEASGYGFCTLPEHHGRLIDADALEQEMIIAEGKAEGGCDYYMEDVIGSAKEYIIDAETIIPATKEGDGE